MENTTLTRDDYGTLHYSANSTDADRQFFQDAMKLVEAAGASKKIPAAFDDMEWGNRGKEKGKRIGDARYHEIYDISPDGRAVLVCMRSVSGDRYGQKTTGKEYFIVRKHGAGCRVVPANKAMAAKAAKAAKFLGEAIEMVSGKKVYKAPANAIRRGYKMVMRNDDGELVSVWDGSPWVIGRTRVEAAAEDRAGGYYYYASLDDAVAAAAAGEIFGDARSHDRLVAVEVEASGRHIQYGKKLCASRLRPIREIAVPAL